MMEPFQPNGIRKAVMETAMSDHPDSSNEVGLGVHLSDVNRHVYFSIKLDLGSNQDNSS